MQIYGISEKEMTPAELFEDFHRRMALRNKISNSLVAISLYEANSESKNLGRYITDGLGISEECVSILKNIAESYSSYQYSTYTSKVLLDILTNRLLQDPDISKLETFRRGFAAAERVFDIMQRKKQPDEQMVREAEQAMKEIDREIESTYVSEENLYRGSFIPR